MGRTGYYTTNCTGEPVVLAYGTTGPFKPRYIYSIDSWYWTPGDAEAPKYILLGSVANLGGASGCASHLTTNFGNPWNAFTMERMKSLPAITKPPDFVGPLHLEPL